MWNGNFYNVKHVVCYLHAGEHQTVAHEVCRVAHSFAGLEAAKKSCYSLLSRYAYLASPVEVGLLLLDVDGVEGVEPEPGGEGEARLVRPPGQGGHHHRAPRLAREREEHVRPRPGEQH